MTVQNAALFSLAMSIGSIFLAVVSVVVSLRTGSRCTRGLKSLRKLALTQSSDSKLAKVETDLAELFSTLSKINTTVRRVSSRHGMQELREGRSSQADANKPPPFGDKKAAREFYLNGKSQRELHMIHNAADTKPETN